MKYLIILLFTINTGLACDWSDIKKTENGYLYPVECHTKVGKLVQNEKKLLKAIDLKDLALQKADERIVVWRNETYNQHDRLLKQQKYNDFTNWMYFGGGIAVTILSVWAAGQLK